MRNWRGAARIFVWKSITIGGFIHMVLVLAVLVLVIRLVQGQRVV